VNIFPVILCGGSGKRLWPLSRNSHPKQFLKFFSGYSLFQETILRISQLSPDKFSIIKFLIVTNSNYRFLVLQQLKEISVENYEIILEPVSLNTAPALTFSAYLALTLSDDPLLVVLPCDQFIDNTDIFIDAINQALSFAERDSIVTLGVEPDRPHTGYGYLEVSVDLNTNVQNVISFIEKPNLEKASSLIYKKNYKWNSGIFILSASIWINAIECFTPDLATFTLDSFNKRSILYGFIEPDLESFTKNPNISIDFAVMEKCTPLSNFKIKMIPLKTKWTDLGNFESIWKFSNLDKNSNAIYGDVVVNNTSNSFIHSSNKLVVVSDLKNIIVVETSDAVLIANKDYPESVKDVVNKLEATERVEKDFHKKVFRPWGFYEIIDDGPDFKVKRISIDPQASLSLQSHKYRSEHWVVIKGIAQVNCENRSFYLKEGESTFIPINTKHRLSNKTSTNVELIEIATGEYLGEDDILRFDDEYGRAI